MFRSICCGPRADVGAGWMIGSSLALVAATFGLVSVGASEPYSHALLYAAFPMAMLVSDAKQRRHPGRLLYRLALTYGAMLAVAQLAIAL